MIECRLWYKANINDYNTILKQPWIIIYTKKSKNAKIAIEIDLKRLKHNNDFWSDRTYILYQFEELLEYKNQVILQVKVV